MLISKLFWLVLILPIIIHPVYSLNINIQDTTVYQGENHKVKLPIIGTINSPEIKNLKIQIIYNAYGISISNVFGNTQYMMRSNNPTTTNNFNLLDSAVIEIYDNNVQSLINDTICILEIEGLVSFDTVAYIKIANVFIDDIEQTEFIPKTATIKIIGTIIRPQLVEGLGDNYPNPFFADTRIPFSINSTTKLKFTLFSSNGEIIQDSWDESNSVIFKYHNKNGEIFGVTPNYLFSRGEYVLYINPLSWRFASGIYFLMMRTDFGTYFKYLMNTK